MTQGSPYTNTYLVVCNDFHFGPKGIDSLKSAGFVEATEQLGNFGIGGYGEYNQTVYHRDGVAVYVADSYDNAVRIAKEAKPDTVFIDRYADKQRANDPIDFATWVVTDTSHFPDTQLVCVGVMAAQTKMSITTRTHGVSDDRLIASNSSVATIISREGARKTRTRVRVPEGQSFGDLVFA